MNNVYDRQQKDPGGHARKRKRKSPWRIILPVIAIMIFAIPAIYYLMPSFKKTRPEDYFAEAMLDAYNAEQAEISGELYGPNQEADASADYYPEASEEEQLQILKTGFTQGVRAVVLQDRTDWRKALLSGDVLYLDYDMVYDELNSRFFWDEESGLMLFTTPLETFEIGVGTPDYTIDGVRHSYSHDILIRDNGRLYISAEFLQLYTNLEYQVSTDAVHVTIRYRWGETLTATARRKSAVRLYAYRKSPVVTQTAAQEKVTVLEEGGKWTQVVTADGYIGYIPTHSLKDISTEEITRDFEEPAYTSLLMDRKVRLIWHAIDLAEVNDYFEQHTKDMSGINVISPTWFSLSDNEGHIRSLADRTYVEKAHDMGLQVWGLVNNFDSEVSTYAVVSAASSRRTLAQALLNEALEYGLDGINVDLEMITQDSAPGYVQFMRELSILCRKNGLILSADVPVPMSFNLYYDRKELGTVADYVIVMGYDEHYYGSEPGSVASLSFEENGILNSLDEVPQEKLVSGMPFYTRVWYMTDNGDGTQEINSDVLTMPKALELIEQSGAELTWDEETQQHYASWENESGSFCQIWLEDEESLTKKAELVNKYSLGGFAIWVLGDEKPGIWAVLENTVTES